MGTLRLHSVPPVLLRRTVAGALVLGRAIANAADPTDETQPEQVIVTEGRYAESATRTLEPILDIPRNVQVVPRQLIDDRAIDDPQEVIQNVSAVMRGGSIFGEGEAFAIRAFDSSSARGLSYFWESAYDHRPDLRGVFSSFPYRIAVLRLASRDTVGDGEHRRPQTCSFVFSSNRTSATTISLSIAFAMS